MDLKQIILMRTDIGMGAGKMVSQGAHASLKATVENMDDTRVLEWLYNDSFTKVVLEVKSEEELLQVVDVAKYRGLITAVIVDDGRTVFDGVSTLTCAAIGPDYREEFIGITDHLNLLS